MLKRLFSVHSLWICLSFALLSGVISSCGSVQQVDDVRESDDCACSIRTGVVLHGDTQAMNGGLISTRFKSLDDLKEVVHIEYRGVQSAGMIEDGDADVRLTYCSDGKLVESIMAWGVSERDFRDARDAGFMDKVRLAWRVPFALWNKDDLVRVFILSRRKYEVFGSDDVAFYDFAEMITEHISADDIALTAPEDLTEKGYLNTFNHISAQAFVTSIFSEEMADFVADVHERFNMPELITGTFSEEQLSDPETNPMDNYVDMLNNEWGQFLGKQLKERYAIDRNTQWTPELLTNYLNDMQAYYSWSFHVAFKPFRPTDEKVVIFAKKLNTVLADVSGMHRSN